MHDSDPTGGKRKIAVASAVVALVIATIKIGLSMASAPSGGSRGPSSCEMTAGRVDDRLDDVFGSTPKDRAAGASLINDFARFAPLSTRTCFPDRPGGEVRALLTLRPGRSRPEVRIEWPAGPVDVVACLEKCLAIEAYPAVDAQLGVRVRFEVD